MLTYVEMILLLAGTGVANSSALSPAAEPATVQIVDGGKARAVIVVSEKAGQAEKNAAEELRAYIEQVSGAALPVAGEPAIEARQPGTVVLAVGNTKLAGTEGLAVSSADPEAFRIVRQGNTVYLLGGGKPGYQNMYPRCLGSGVEFAAHEFLERVCGIRWLRPGPNGTYVPSRKTITVGKLDVERAPSYQYRNLRYWYEGKTAWVLGTEYYEQRNRRETTRLNEWMKHNKLNRVSVVPGGHAFVHIVPKSEYAEHPEYFALFKGTRKPGSSRHCGWQLCTTNPEVIDRTVRYVRRRFEEGRMLVAISPNDGGGFCECEQCRGLDVPGWVDESGLPILSNRIATFVNAVARRVKDDFPGHYVGTMAYGWYKEPPRGIRFEPNVMVWMINRQWYNWIPGRREAYYDFYNTWRKVQPDVYVTSGEFLTHEHRCGAPWSIISLDAEAIKWPAHRYKVKSGWSAIQNDWGNNGIKYYAAARLFWDADKDLNAVLDDYCASMYGAAAVPMRNYWDRLEQGEREWQQEPKESVSLRDVVFAMPQIVSPAVRNDCRQRLQEAAKLADTPWARANVGFATRGFEYTEMTTGCFDLYQQLLKATDETEIVRLTDTLRATWLERRALVEQQRDENIVGYAQYNLEILDAGKFGGQQAADQRFAFLGTIEVDKLRNPGIEEDVRGSWWRYMGQMRLATEDPHSGERCLSVADSESWALQLLMLVPGRKYRLSGWIRTQDVGGTAGIMVHNVDKPTFQRICVGLRHVWQMSDGARSRFEGTCDWQRVSCEFTPEVPEVRIACYLGGDGGEAFFDDFTLERLD